MSKLPKLAADCATRMYITVGWTFNETGLMVKEVVNGPWGINEISKLVGAVTVIGFVIFDPCTEKLCTSLAVPAHHSKGVIFPLRVTDDLAWAIMKRVFDNSPWNPEYTSVLLNSSTAVFASESWTQSLRTLSKINRRFTGICVVSNSFPQ